MRSVIVICMLALFVLALWIPEILDWCERHGLGNGRSDGVPYKRDADRKSDSGR